jgi:hypothetical protein
MTTRPREKREVKGRSSPRLIQHEIAGKSYTHQHLWNSAKALLTATSDAYTKGRVLQNGGYAHGVPEF